VWVAVLFSALLGPGTGQLYNRQYKKGLYLVFLTLILLGAFTTWLTSVLSPFLPVDLATADPVEMRKTIETALPAIIQKKGLIFYTYQLLLLAVWVYSIVDAYKIAKRRLALKGVV